jgi:hypothetical protein
LPLDGEILSYNKMILCADVITVEIFVRGSI